MVLNIKILFNSNTTISIIYYSTTKRVKYKIKNLFLKKGIYKPQQWLIHQNNVESINGNFNNINLYVTSLFSQIAVHTYQYVR